ncbi:MAG: thermonuclease family protein [Planctomycetaceae bacterium]|nr:thermonuclease family protein [Planctomycetaceae bacterium]
MVPLPKGRLPRHPWQAVLVILAVSMLSLWRTWPSRTPWDQPTQPVDASLHRVARVVDGDTLVLADGKQRVRLIGADTPETVKPNWPVEPWGPEATAFTRKFLADGQNQVRLEFDAERHDKYGRLLAYVWCDDRMLNEELIRAGLARAELWYRYAEAKKERFRRAESEAKAARRGIWSGARGL